MKTLPLRRRRWLRATLIVLAAAALAWVALIVLVRPSNTRDWSPDQARLATASFDSHIVHLHNVRNAVYRSSQDYDVHWEERDIDLDALTSVWFVVEPFADWRGPAHTFLSFGFADGDYLAISVEIRKERGESFSPLRGLLRQYELIYVIGDERDLIGLRANHRHDLVYLYPIRTTPERMRALLVSMLDRANALAADPEFYNTLSDNCTSNIVDHVDHIVPGRIPLSFATVLPAFSDDLAYDLGLIDTELPRESYREAFRINEAARRFADSEEFSRGIRSGLK
jgi:hypothetical protein